MKKNILRIGIDIHGVADADPPFFSALTRILVQNTDCVTVVEQPFDQSRSGKAGTTCNKNPHPLSTSPHCRY